jgi:hypothetical protein
MLRTGSSGLLIIQIERNTQSPPIRDGLRSNVFTLHNECGDVDSLRPRPEQLS